MKEMTSDDFYGILENIKKRPGMYIGTKSLIKLKHFLDGLFHALYFLDKQNKDPVFLQGFQEWIQIKYDITSTHHWSGIINFYSSNEAEAFDLFYEHLEEFISLDKEVRDYKNIIEVKEKWMELKSEYWMEYHKIRF